MIALDLRFLQFPAMMLGLDPFRDDPAFREHAGVDRVAWQLAGLAGRDDPAYEQLQRGAPREFPGDLLGPCFIEREFRQNDPVDAARLLAGSIDQVYEKVGKLEGARRFEPLLLQLEEAPLPAFALI